MLKIIYKLSPFWIQNTFLSIENIFVLYKKYGYIPLLNPLNKIQKDVLNTEISSDLKTLLKRLNKFIAYAIKHTEYYRENEKKYSILNSLDDLAYLPILEKSYLKENTKKFYSDESNNRNSRLLSTSGSTGSPMKIKVSVNDLQKRYKLVLKNMIEFGLDLRKPYARITGHDIADNDRIYRKDFFHNHYFLSAFHLSDKTISKYYNVIVQNNIEALDGYPSAIYTMVKLLMDNNYKIECIKSIYVTSEKLHQYQKDVIEGYFNCKVFNYYGSNEQAPYVFTCTNDKLHLADSTGVIEVVDNNGNYVPNGEVGSMLITSFTSHFMPLIRYRIGDSCVISTDQTCNCGNDGIIIEEIIGRDEDIFKTIDGVYITRFSPVLKYLPKNIVESQLVLSNSGLSAKLYYVSREDLDHNSFIDFEKTLISKIGNKYAIKYIPVETILQTSKGKKKAIIIEN